MSQPTNSIGADGQALKTCYPFLNVLEVPMSKSPKESRRPDRADDPWEVPEVDIAAWAERERKRRQAWLEGPDEEEKQAWAEAERKRRKREYRDELLDMDLDEGRRMADRLIAGVTNRMVEAPLRKLGNLLREGQDAEDRQNEPLRRRRRVYPDDDA
jgi:hypothetical protein